MDQSGKTTRMEHEKAVLAGQQAQINTVADIVGMVPSLDARTPPPRDMTRGRSFSMTDADMQYVWAVLPGGSRLVVFLGDMRPDMQAFVHPGPGSAPWRLPVDVPILRNVQPRVAAHELTEAELRGAIGLIGRLAYGDEAAIKLEVTVLAPTPRSPVEDRFPPDGYVAFNPALGPSYPAKGGVVYDERRALHVTRE